MLAVLDESQKDLFNDLRYEISFGLSENIVGVDQQQSASILEISALDDHGPVHIQIESMGDICPIV